MPQIRCPNCGLTINLENRKETDVGMITEAVQNRERTFTDLLHITRLPRKTLSLRLKDMCENGMIAKEGGVYRANGFHAKNGGWNLSRHRLSVLTGDKRLRAGLVMIALMVSVPAFSYAMGAFLGPSPAQQPVVIGKFTMVLEADNVRDLGAWQVYIGYDPRQMTVIDVQPGNFLDNGHQLFLNKTDINGDGSPDGALLLADSSFPDTPLKTGDGTLATIVFGYYVSTYTEPKIVSNWNGFVTGWIDSNNSPMNPEQSTIIPFEVPATLTLTRAANP